MFQYNDNELLYLISDHNEDAYMILSNKYQPLILSKIKKNNLQKNEAEEYYSEALICFNKAIRTYNDLYFTSFNRYLNLIIDRRFIDLNKKRQKHEKIVYLDTLEDYLIDNSKDDNNLINEENLNLSNFEERIYNMKFINNQKPREIAKELNCDVKQIYDAIDRIRRKARKK